MADYQEYKGWKIEKHGGFCTMSRYCASKNNDWFWMFKLREVKNTIDSLEIKDLNFKDISNLYREPLYN
jgi:hypothetical protein